MTKLRDWLVAGAVLLLSKTRPSREDEERIVPAAPPDPRAERWVLALFGLATLSAVGFIVVYALDRLSHQTQWLGLTLGLALTFLAAACTVIARRLVVTEELAEDYPQPEDHVDDQQAVVQIVEESGDRLTRKRLLKLGGAAAGGSLGLALITPAVSLGPVLDTRRLYGTPWTRGRRLVDETGTPYRADGIEEEAFYTAYPEGANREQLGAPVLVVRLKPAALRLGSHKPAAEWAPQGILAFSKICTHAGCAIALYRKPTFPVTEPKPAFVCPCHYSTFDPATGGTVIFGPAGRPLPQLPLLVDSKGELRARGNFDQPVGPSWWGVRRERPNP
jgi:ubiquinol-cytochrome c reductase iron-sulfur subunit